MGATAMFKRAMRRYEQRAWGMDLESLARGLASVRLGGDPFEAWRCLMTFGGMALKGDAARRALFLLGLAEGALARLREGLAEEERETRARHEAILTGAADATKLDEWCDRYLARYESLHLHDLRGGRLSALQREEHDRLHLELDALLPKPEPMPDDVREATAQARRLLGEVS